MKRIVFFLIFCLLFSFPVSAETVDPYGEMYEDSGAGEIEDILPDETRKILGHLNVDISDSGWVNELTFESVWGQILDFLKEGATTPMKCGGLCLAVLLLTAAASTFDFFRPFGEVAGYIFAVCAVSGMLIPLFSLIQSSVAAVKGISTLMTGFVPLYAGLLTLGGQALTASGMSFLLLGAAGLVGGLASFVILPLMSCYLGVGMAGSVMPMGGINRLGDGMKKAAMWGLSLTLTVFLGLLSVQTAVNRAADGLGLKTVRFMIGTFIPVAGGALSETLTTLLGSLKLLKTSVLMFVAVAVAFTVLPLVIELLIWRLTLFVLDVAADILGVKAKTEILRAADCVLALLVGVLLFTATLFIISLAVISGGG